MHAIDVLGHTLRREKDNRFHYMCVLIQKIGIHVSVGNHPANL